MPIAKAPDVGVPAERGRARLAALLVAVAVAIGAFVLVRESDPAPESAAPPSGGSARPASAPASTASTESTPTRSVAPTARRTASARPLAVGRGRPSCSNGPCQVQHRLTRSFLTQYDGQQTLLLARAEEADQDGNFLHAFLVDPAGRVLWQEHGFGWEFRRIDERFAIRFDEAQHAFFRAYVADNTYVYVLDMSGSTPRLIGPNGRRGTDGFANGEIVERAGETAFAIRESVVDCSDPDSCRSRESLYRWNGSAYVED